MENKFEYLADRGDHGGHLAGKFLKKYFSSQSYRDYRVPIWLSLLSNSYTSNKCVYLKTEFLNLKNLSSTRVEVL